MLRLLCLTLVSAALVLSACSPGNPAPAQKPAPQTSAERDNLEGVVVQKNGDNAEAAKAAAKAEKVANLKKLLERLNKAATLNDAFTISEEIEDLGKDVKDGPRGRQRYLARIVHPHW